jgi:hypothetical protein
MDRSKYPKTLHLPWSPGLQNDDRMLQSTGCFKGAWVVITEKMDGENTTMYHDAIHARSLSDMDPHPSRPWVQALHGSIQHDIPGGWRICGENLFAKHSIHYTNLLSYFQVFAIFDENDWCMNWCDTKHFAELLGLVTVPKIYEGPYDEEYFKSDLFLDTFDFTKQEGYVIRVEEAFPEDLFQQRVAKYVRKGHVQTSEHWKTQPMVKNLLKR